MTISLNINLFNRSRRDFRNEDLKNNLIFRWKSRLINVYWYCLCFLFLVLNYSCSSPIKETSRKTGNDYAMKFSIEEYEKFTIISVFDPWQRSAGEEIRYILVKDYTHIPDSLQDLPSIKVPVSNVIVFSTTHVGFIEALGGTNGIRAVSGLKYVCNDNVRKNILKKEVFDVGYPPGINYEQIIRLSPDLVFLYGIESSVTGIASRLQKAGIQVFIVAEYLEPDPLGKMEWIKVFGQLYDKEQLAEKLFYEARTEYEHIKKITDTLKNKPDVIVGLPWKNTWYMSGGRSYTAKLIEDAGGNYLWKENTSSEYIPLALEAVLPSAMIADAWINTGSASSLREIELMDPRFTNFSVFKNAGLYNNNAMNCQNGGNPFWESGVVEPHIILKDLVKIFHPELLPGHDFAYYRKLE